MNVPLRNYSRARQSGTLEESDDSGRKYSHQMDRHPPLPQETNTSGITSKTDKRIVVSGISGLWTLRAETNSRMWKKLENPEANCLNFISA